MIGQFILTRCISGTTCTKIDVGGDNVVVKCDYPSSMNSTESWQEMIIDIDIFSSKRHTGDRSGEEWEGNIDVFKKFHDRTSRLTADMDM